METNTNEVQVVPTQGVTTQEGLWVEISRITVPEDVRKHTQEDIDSRATSMAREGQLENILLSKEGDQLILVYGNGRLESAKKLGWDKIRADVKEGLSESQKLMMTLAENEEREDGSPFWIARLYNRIAEVEHLSPEKLPEYLNKDRATVYRYLSLAKVPSEVQAMSHACDIGLRQCLAIAKLSKVEDQLQVMKECAEDGLAGKALEKRIKALLNPKPAGEEKPEKAAQEPAGPFQFIWKGNSIVIKGRPFTPHTESLGQWTNELLDAYDRFMEEEKTQKAA